MIWWLLTALASTTPSPCQDIPILADTAGRPPNAWPTYAGRCLDQGSKHETLLDRARRCAVEEPEDPAPIKLLGYLGDVADVPLLEALAYRSAQSHLAVGALAQLDPSVARPALVRIACHAPHAYSALDQLARDPRTEEWPLYAHRLHGSEEVAKALGRLQMPEARRVLIQALPQGPSGGNVLAGLLLDRSPEGVQALLDLRSDDKLHVRLVRTIPPDHPAFHQILAEAEASPPAIRTSLVRRAGALDEGRAELLLRRALDDEDPSVRASAAAWLARVEERLAALDAIAADLDHPERAVAFHEVRVGSGDVGSVEALRTLRDVPEVRWHATRALLGAREAVPEAERRALAEWVQTQSDAPRPVMHAAHNTLTPPRPAEPRERQLLDLSGVHPTLSRERTPVRDHKRWARQARAALDDDADDNDALALAILPWVGDDTDIDRLAGTSRRGPRTRPLADLGTPAALERMATFPSRSLPWVWSRSERGWSELVVTTTNPWSLHPIVRPEIYALALETLETLDPRHPGFVDPSTWNIRQQREALAFRSFREVKQLPTAASLATMDDRFLAGVAQHPGHRWIVLDALDELPEARRAHALEGLVQARWYGVPPEVVVEAARQSTTRGGWRLRIELGETEAALEAMKGRGRGAMWALEAVLDALAEPDPPPELLDPVVAWIHSGELDPMTVRHLLKPPVLRPVVKEALLAGDIQLRSPCDALRWIQDRGGLDMGDEWIVDTLMSCGRSAISLRLEGEHMRALQQQMLARELDPGQLRLALSLDRTDAELVRPYLDTDNPTVRGAMLGTMQQAGIPEGEVDRVVAWLREELASEEGRGWNRGAMNALQRHAPDELVPILAAELADHDDWQLAAALKRIGTDDAIAAILPVLERGTDRKVEELARWVKDHAGPVYEEHRALVDGFVTPTWKRNP